MPQQPLDTLFLWVGQPADEPEHLLMMLTAGDDGEHVYRPLMAVSREHADQLAEIAQQAADSLGVPAALREYLATAETFGAPPLVILEPRPDPVVTEWVDMMHGDAPEAPDEP